MSPLRPTVVELEEAAFRAWPAAETVPLDGWQLRSTEGVTRRANSAWTLRAEGSLTLEERVASTEAFYAERRSPPTIQVTQASEPAHLDAYLLDRGYALDAPVTIQEAPVAELALPLASYETSVSTRYDEEWLGVTATRGRFGAVRDVYCGILERIGHRAGFATVRSQGHVVAAALGVLDSTLLGIFNMHTLPEARRRGAGTAALAALVEWARAEGAVHAYLQVERDNPAALSLYARAGFKERYGYHYRVKRRP